MKKIRHILLRSLKKLSFSGAVILFHLPFAFSQPKATFQWSEFQKVNKYSKAAYIFKYPGGYGDIIRYTSKFQNRLSKFQVNLYDKDLKLTKQKTFIINKYKEKVLDIWYSNNRLFFLTQGELANQRSAARLRILSTDSLDNPHITADIIVVNETHFTKQIDFRLSHKDSSLSIWHINPSETADAKQSITSRLYSNDMILLDKAIIDLPAMAELCEVLRVDDIERGQFLISTKEYDVRAIDQRAFKPNYTFTYYVTNPAKETMKKFSFKDELTYLDRGKLKWKEGLLEATGTFAAKYKGPKIGIWYVKYSFNTEKILCDTVEYFDKNIRTLPNNGFQSSIMRNSKMEGFYIDFFIKLNTDDRIIIAEQFFKLPATVGSSYTYNLFYGDILILYLNRSGEIYNAKRLIKAQQTFNNYGEFSSYYIERKDSSFRFFYNDNYRNDGGKRFKHLIWHKQSSLNITDVSEHTTTTTALANYKKSDGIIQTRDMLELAPNTYLIYCYQKQKGKLGVMHVE